MVLGHGVQAATTASRGESAGVKRTAVEDVLAALSMETSEGSIPDPSKHLRQRSKMHEVEMDENKVVMHTRRGSTAVGVTPSDPSAIVDLFQEVESIGSTYLPPDETDSEDEDSSHHKAADAAAATAADAASGGSAAASSDPPGQQQQSNADSASSMVEPAWGSGGDPQAPRPYWPTDEEAAGVASGEGGAVVMLGGKEGGVEANGKSGEPRWSRRSIKIGSSVGCGEQRLHGNSHRQKTQSQQPGHHQEQAAAAGVPEPPPVRPGLPPPRGSSSALQATSVSESTQAPLRRKTSMGSFQKGMGESLTGRLRKQLDIPDAPKREIDTNIPVKQIQSLKYLAQVTSWV
ncbi:hypothetical protein Esi_0164_0068 [Ectocarpus siliculosus]|uniref:Uncharacterized protein n=1 Tax=Ectocarpus siliculosus TaxID=2880 RepID=D7FM91_ECTSI|nr:hypothetical protein Esi_0164_0068 [Ectocarpus siliculosus]|eukprot:CBJ29914.1 hypothetical protein Esi_0164_0068 [Ectocarpus siliculosus]